MFQRFSKYENANHDFLKFLAVRAVVTILKEWTGYLPTGYTNSGNTEKFIELELLFNNLSCCFYTHGKFPIHTT